MNKVSNSHMMKIPRLTFPVVVVELGVIIGVAVFVLCLCYY